MKIVVYDDTGREVAVFDQLGATYPADFKERAGIMMALTDALRHLLRIKKQHLDDEFGA